MRKKTNRYFATLIKGSHILSDSDYVAGRISAAFRILCGDDTIRCFGLTRTDNTEETCYVIWATPEQYGMAMSYINEWYPGLCEFDYPFENLPAECSRVYTEED